MEYSAFRRLAACWLAVAVLLVSATTGWSSIITFTYTGTGSGQVGTVTFTTTYFTITAIGDTGDVVTDDAGTYTVAHSSAQIDITGVGVFDITSPSESFFNSGFLGGLAGFSLGPFQDVFHVPLGVSWDMNSSIGPISSSEAFLFPEPVSTSGGDLEFAEGMTEGSFQAVVGEVPEPASFLVFAALIASAFFAFLLRRRREKLCPAPVFAANRRVPPF